METYNFYEIKSKKSQIYVDGLRQISLVCDDQPDIHCFLWVNQEQKLAHLQFLFNEKIIEWFSGRKSLVISETNRRSNNPEQIGIHKGVRTIHPVNDDKIRQEGLDIIRLANFPKNYKEIIQSGILT